MWRGLWLMGDDRLTLVDDGAVGGKRREVIKFIKHADELELIVQQETVDA